MEQMKQRYIFVGKPKDLPIYQNLMNYMKKVEKRFGNLLKNGLKKVVDG